MRPRLRCQGIRLKHLCLEKAYFHYLSSLLSFEQWHIYLERTIQVPLACRKAAGRGKSRLCQMQL